ncbi:MAG: hypothetical protein RSE13_15165 [Planktothrix sp. GU0601_MAG3]|nr:MAG: hypothetical protein RSE13_15165 [Planktothrix sp. GU0601_MAG3]
MMRLIVDMILIFESAIAPLPSQITKGAIALYLEDAIALIFRKCDRSPHYFTSILQFS